MGRDRVGKGYVRGYGEGVMSKKGRGYVRVGRSHVMDRVS